MRNVTIWACVYPASDGVGWVGQIPALGLWTCGATQTETMEMCRDATKGYFEAECVRGLLLETLRDLEAALPSSLETKMPILELVFKI